MIHIVYKHFHNSVVTAILPGLKQAYVRKKKVQGI